MQSFTNQDNKILMRREEIFESYLIVTAIDKNYLKIFDLWMYYFEKLNYNKCLRVITYDTQSEKYVEEKGIITIPVKEKIRTARDIYVTRLNAISQLLKSGKNVIHTDADAFWLKDLLPSTIKKDFDLQISIGHGIPKRAIAEWGFSLCCGFFILHSNARTIKFFDEWLCKSIEMNHDQNALNEMFLVNTTKWGADNPLKNTGYCPAFDISIEAIDYHIISRKNGGEISVFHPYLSGSNSQMKLLSVLSKLMKIEQTSFIRVTYYKTLFNLFGWITVLAEMYGKMGRGVKKLVRS